MSITTENLKKYLNLDLNVTVLKTVDSTNKYLKQKAISGEEEGSFVIAEAQTNGRGRFDRKFHSPEGGGIYMSVLLKPELSAEDAVLITAAAAVAVSEACEALSGRKAMIKWVNDIYIDRKKVCGILTEGSIKPDGCFAWAVLGIGINAFPPKGGFESDIKDIAGAVFDKEEKDIRCRLAAEVLNRFFEYYKNLGEKTFLQKYREKSFVKGKAVRVIRNGEQINATALDIDDKCRLLVEYEDSRREYISSGEISIRL